MATFLEIGLLEYFNIIFYLIFIFVLLYAILSLTKVLGENKNLNAMLALALALLLALSGPTRDLIKFVTPTFFIFIFFAFFAVLIYKFLGASDENVLAIMGTKSGTRSFILIIILIIILSSFGKIFFTEPITSDVNETAVNKSAVGTRGESALAATLTHPKVLGLALILLIGAFAMSYLSKQANIIKFE
ncbi:MAG: hypothetical protein KJ968_04335 [Nanoarchaeota archaeon]|nr:hypothetical protein [Nanoarchaeota archaeon]